MVLLCGTAADTMQTQHGLEQPARPSYVAHTMHLGCSAHKHSGRHGTVALQFTQSTVTKFVAAVHSRSATAWMTITCRPSSCRVAKFWLTRMGNISYTLLIKAGVAAKYSFQGSHSFPSGAVECGLLGTKLPEIGKWKSPEGCCLCFGM